MSQHLGHRHSDEIHVLNMEIERLRHINTKMLAALKAIYEDTDDLEIRNIAEATIAEAEGS